MIADIIYVVLNCISVISLVILGIQILKVRNKKQIHYFFLYSIIFMITCNIGYILLVISKLFLNYDTIYFVYIIFLGSSFWPVFSLLIGIAFVKQDLAFNYKLFLLFLIPIITNILLWTNEYHHLFYKDYVSSMQYSFGIWFYIHAVWSYLCMFGQIFYLIYFALNGRGFFSKQVKIVILGSIVPIILNIIWLIGKVSDIKFLKFYSSYDILPISFTFSFICYSLAITKYDFLKIIPIATETIVNRISDSYIVVDDELRIITYNEPFVNTFSSIIKFNRKEAITDILENNNVFGIDSKILKRIIHKATQKKKSLKFERHIVLSNFDKWFNIEITPIDPIKKIGTIILFKDTTEIKESTERLIEREKLATLGGAAAGFSHTVNTLLSAIKQDSNFLKQTVPDYRKYIEKIVNEEERMTQLEYFDEVVKVIDKQDEILLNVVKLLRSLNSQMAELNKDDDKFDSSSFTLQEFIERIEFFQKMLC